MKKKMLFVLLTAMVATNIQAADNTKNNPNELKENIANIKKAAKAIDTYFHNENKVINKEARLFSFITVFAAAGMTAQVAYNLYKMKKGNKSFLKSCKALFHGKKASGLNVFFSAIAVGSFSYACHCYFNHKARLIRNIAMLNSKIKKIHLELQKPNNNEPEKTDAEMQSKQLKPKQLLDLLKAEHNNKHTHSNPYTKEQTNKRLENLKKGQISCKTSADTEQPKAKKLETAEYYKDLFERHERYMQQFLELCNRKRKSQGNIK